MKKILLTGASGYVGRNFFDAYKEKYQIQTFSLQKESLDDLNLFTIDTVLHCAALVHQKKEHTYKKYYDINVKYPLELAKKAKKSGVNMFIFLSTVAVYGENYNYITEETPPAAVTNYGSSKLEAENELKKLDDENFNVVILRIPMVYGHKAPGNMQTLVTLVKRVPFLPFGQIRNKRSFLYIENFLFIINTIINKNISGIFLLSDEKPLSTTKLIELIAEALDKKIYLVCVPLFESLLKLVKPSFHKRLYGSLEVDNQDTFRRLFGVAKVSLPYSVEDGIRLMIEGEA